MTRCPPDGWCLDGLDAQNAPVTTAHLRAVWAQAANDVWVVGDQGTILHFDGTQWNRATSGVSDDLFGVWAASATDVWAVGGSGNPTVALHALGRSSLHGRCQGGCAGA